MGAAFYVVNRYLLGYKLRRAARNVPATDLPLDLASGGVIFEAPIIESARSQLQIAAKLPSAD